MNFIYCALVLSLTVFASSSLRADDESVPSLTTDSEEETAAAQAEAIEALKSANEPTVSTGKPIKLKPGEKAIVVKRTVVTVKSDDNSGEGGAPSWRCKNI